ncbi:MAG: hypothetical protein E7389_04985 [Ruminococcaceae bacterium]|nr:hypothetical protein [Oscillospiraceae bacterium]
MKRKLNHTVMLLIFLSITVFINLIFNRLNISADLTENELYSVSDEARSITGKVDGEINVYCFVKDENKADVICEFTRNFCSTSEKINYRAVNPVKHPEMTKRYTEGGREITDRTVVFDNGENYKIIPYKDMFSYNYLTGQNNLLVAEEKYCLAIMSLNKKSSVRVAFLTGHGEAYDGSLKERVENIGAKCGNVDIRNEEISGFDVLMIISPKTDFTGQELEKLDAFLNDDGTVIVSIDGGTPQHEMFEGFLAEWGITVQRNTVLSTDAKSTMGNQPYSVIGKLNSHPVTDGLIKNNISPVFFASGSITPIWEVHGGIKVTVLAESAENAVAVPIDAKQSEERGVFPLLTLSQGEKGRIFTFGSNMFFSDELKAYNEDLLRNIITWSKGGELMKEIPPKIVAGSNIKVPKNNITFLIVIFGVVIPAIIAAAGIVAGIRRRRI